eukprot:403340338
MTLTRNDSKHLAKDVLNVGNFIVLVVTYISVKEWSVVVLSIEMRFLDLQIARIVITVIHDSDMVT